MTTAEANQTRPDWSVPPDRKPRRAAGPPRRHAPVDFIALIAEYQKLEEMLALAIDRQEAAASAYFCGTAIETEGPAGRAAGAAARTLAPIRTTQALCIEDINDAEFRIATITARLSEIEDQVLAATPRCRADGVAKVRFMLSLLIADGDQGDRLPDRMIEKCMAVLG
jgi:hypothetical protein